METIDQAAQEQIASILERNGIKATFRHVPTTFDPKSKEWQHIAWKVEFSSPRGKFETDYRQGIGHLPDSLVLPAARITLARAAEIRKSLETGQVCIWRDGFNNAMPTSKSLMPPTAADVIYSLISDASAADYATFEDWASDMGDDPDSRKAEKTFNACRQIALDLNRVFGAAVVEELKPITAEM